MMKLGLVVCACHVWVVSMEDNMGWCGECNTFPMFLRELGEDEPYVSHRIGVQNEARQTQ